MKYHTLILASLLMVGCNQHQKCIGIKDGKYSGNAIALYHKPISGRAIELFIFPICDDSKIDTTSLCNIFRAKIQEGISTTIGGETAYPYRLIFNNSKRINLAEKSSLAWDLQSIYVCPIYIEFEDAENNTIYITKTDSIMHKDITCYDSKRINLDYYYTNNIKVNSLKIHPSWNIPRTAQ